ncbi:MAG TPA: glycosyltransferase [Solirubrobacterales bacterium]|nr:glycosyltransferase [Solirubrobacterales bacterium]
MPARASRNQVARALLDGVRGASRGSVSRAVFWGLLPDCVPADAPAPGSFADIRIELPIEYEARDGGWFMRSIERGLGELATLERAPIPQRGLGLAIARAHRGGRTLDFAIDFFDEPRVDADVAAAVGLYFKLQFLRGGYEQKNVVPGGYVQPRNEPHDQFCRLRRYGREHPGDRVYGRFGASFGEGPRRRAVELLEGRPSLGYRGGMGIVPYVQSLQEAARAAVCVDLPGRGPFCYRLVDYFAVGACVVAAPHPTRMPVELEDRRNIVYARADLSDLPDLCEWLLEDEAARRRIGAEAAAYFDRHLHYLPLAGHYLRQIAAALDGASVAQ